MQVLLFLRLAQHGLQTRQHFTFQMNSIHFLYYIEYLTDAICARIVELTEAFKKSNHNKSFMSNS